MPPPLCLLEAAHPGLRGQEGGAEGQREDDLAVPLAAAGAARPGGALVDVPLALLGRWVLEKAALLVGLRIWQGTKTKCTNHYVLRLLRAPSHLFPVDDVVLVEGPRRAIDFEQVPLRLIFSRVDEGCAEAAFAAAPRPPLPLTMT